MGDLKSKLSTNPPKTFHCLLSYPAPWVLLVTINREKQMNSIPFPGHWEMSAIFKWYDEEPSLRVAVLTGAGQKSFCAGQDIIELAHLKTTNPPPEATRYGEGGFAWLSRRKGRKPVIAAVNGYCLGGGFETTLNCDMVIASPSAQFGLPEVLRGIFAGAGGLPRLIRNCGLQVASDIALTGRKLSAQEAMNFGLINQVSSQPETVVEEAIERARAIAENSPDAVIVTRAALREAWETGSVEEAVCNTNDKYSDELIGGENAIEGMQAFAERRQPRWKPSKL